MANEKDDPTEGEAMPPGTEKREPEPRQEEPDTGESSDESVAESDGSTEDPAAETESTDEPAPEAEPAVEPPPEPEPAEHAPTARAEESAPDAEDHQEYYEEHHGWSFAARALAFLVILLAGAALGIWGAPKLAPMLPSGLAPVANWLTPGGDGVSERVTELESRLETGLADVSTRLGALSEQGAADVSSAISAAEDRIEAELATLREELSNTDDAELRQRLGRLEAAVEGQRAEFATLKEQFASSAGTAQPDEDTAARIDLYAAELDGLRAEVGNLTDTVNGLAARIDEVAATADRSIDAAQERVATVEQERTTALSAAAVASDVALIRAALAAGQPFEEPVERLATASDITVPDGLAAAAPTGAPTILTLQDRFADAAHAAVRASIQASAGSGVLARSRAFLEAQVASRSLTPQEGMGTDAVLSRMEGHLRGGDLDGTLAEADALPSEAAAAMQAWLADARLRAGADAGLEALDASLSAMN